MRAILTDPKGIHKTIQALARMGYPYDEIKAAVSAIPMRTCMGGHKIA
jgi:Holliday junction resolvasome RuvABC DNA-binding subunit